MTFEDCADFQTHTLREKDGKLQEKRNALMEARLAKVRERRLKQKPGEGTQLDLQILRIKPTLTLIRDRVAV